MIQQSLDGEWALREVGSPQLRRAHVPGGVHLDLMAAGLISDPFVGDEELRTQWVAERDWEYGRTFLLPDGLAAQHRVELVCDGLDTLAEVYLNGQHIGSADNMFRAWRWDVRDHLRPGRNALRVIFRSAPRRAAELDASRHMATVADQLPGAPYLRKAPAHFGWDWGPKLPNVGFWQGVRLEGWSVARLRDVRLTQELGDYRAVIRTDVNVERLPDARDALSVSVSVRHPDGRIDARRKALPAGCSTARLDVEIVGPELWWPNGLGPQPLYQVDVELEEAGAGGRSLDRRRLQIGLRTLELRREPDELGESFIFAVNGVPVFAKGSNWIPADTFPGRVDTARRESLLRAAATANHNMVRVWGGGYPEPDDFYDACDRLGLLVWQDFIFSCSVYPLTDDAFLASVRIEVDELVRRLRHHACLALWCGNNEMERGWASWDWSRPENADLRAAYVDFFGETLPGWVRALDAATPYWPSSPSSGGPLETPIGAGSGDEHEWNVWQGLAPFSTYGCETYRFVSEFGFESLPSPRTISAFAPDQADWNLGSWVLDHHQRCEAGNARILYYLAQQYRLPGDFEGLVYLSQVLQAEAMRVGVEHWRRGRDRCGGALYWQLNDCWPASSWSSIDYFGRWKALHYATRRFFAPVLLSAEARDGKAIVSVTNDLAESWSGEARWSLERINGRVVVADQREFSAHPLATTRIAVVPIPAGPDEQRQTVLVMELWHAGSAYARAILTFVPDKHLALSRASVEVSVEPVRAPSGASGAGARLVLRSNALARWVELSLDGADALFSDNYFDLPTGRERTIEMNVPDGWTIERLRSGLRIRSLADVCRADPDQEEKP